ncbi:zinc ribbon domain-containing protein [Thalassoroseus pseudoceratinae]|uniref:hypothetical protein n=1 Tax=Thalassoroseus pseudoceratinae TaxID=2713176 RepID=UPI00141DA793|nr:hypothetical protein [Thalassoroseus pseudoceratinae]
MSIDVLCPECEYELHLPNEDMLGRWARCPQCQTKFQLLRPEKSPVPKVESPATIESPPPTLDKVSSTMESDDSEECVQTLEDVSDVGFDDLSFDFSDPPVAEEPEEPVPTDAERSSRKEDAIAADESGSLPPALFEELFGRRSFDAKRFVKNSKQSTSPSLLEEVDPQSPISQTAGEPNRIKTVWIVVLAFVVGSLIGFGLWLATEAMRSGNQSDSTSSTSSIENGPTFSAWPGLSGETTSSVI